MLNLKSTSLMAILPTTTDQPVKEQQIVSRMP